jgi:hypothetical protein
MSQIPQQPSTELQVFQAKAATYDHAILEMENHLSVEGGTIILGVKSGSDIGIDPDTFDILSRSLAQVNENLRSGKLHPSQVELHSAFGAAAPSAVARITAGGDCPGTDSFNTYWWGYKIRMNQCLVGEIVGIMQTDASVLAIEAAIAGIIAVAIPPVALAAGIAAVAAGLWGVGQGVIQYYDSQCGNQGLAFNFLWVSPIPWCTCS